MPVVNDVKMQDEEAKEKQAPQKDEKIENSNSEIRVDPDVQNTANAVVKNIFDKVFKP